MLNDRSHNLCNEKDELTVDDKNKLFDKDTSETFRKRPKQLEKWMTDAGKTAQLAFEKKETLDRHPVANCFPILKPIKNSPTAPPTTSPPARLASDD